MKKPKVVNVFGKAYQIKYEDMSKTDACGLTDNKNYLIIIDSSLKGDDLKHTLLHESFHAILYRTSVTQSLSHELEEVIVDQIATFLVDNYNFDL
jgi:Zn-dependent peptidase ImmA (M78 family)